MPPKAESPDILLVHGAWHGAWCWERNFAPWLREQGHTVATLDLPGHGRSGPKRIPLHSVREYVDAVEAAVVDSDRPVIVAGHSMGGFVVQKLMERRPAKLAGVALVASAPPQGVLNVVLHLLRVRPLDLLRAVGGMNLYVLVREPRFMKALFYSETLDSESAQQYWRLLQNESFRAFLDMIALDLPKPSRVDPALPKWVIGGELDAVFPPAIVLKTGQSYGVEAKLYPGMAHNLMLDAGWETVVRDFAEWVRKV